MPSIHRSLLFVVILFQVNKAAMGEVIGVVTYAVKSPLDVAARVAGAFSRALHTAPIAANTKE
jgi:hypothetical protein